MYVTIPKFYNAPKKYDLRQRRKFILPGKMS